MAKQHNGICSESFEEIKVIPNLVLTDSVLSSSKFFNCSLQPTAEYLNALVKHSTMMPNQPADDYINTNPVWESFLPNSKCVIHSLSLYSHCWSKCLMHPYHHLLKFDQLPVKCPLCHEDFSKYSTSSCPTPKHLYFLWISIILDLHFTGTSKPVNLKMQHRLLEIDVSTWAMQMIPVTPTLL